MPGGFKFLGIELLPRIRNWKDLVFYKADARRTYKHIEGLFVDVLKLAREMGVLQVGTISVLSIRITPHTSSRLSVYVRLTADELAGVCQGALAS